jgi:putative PIN family toxin of toxin-antitoxin system
MKVVFDTNVWVSALAFQGEVRKVLETAIAEEVQPVVSLPILRELERVLFGKKFGFPPSFAVSVVHHIQLMSLVVHPTQQVHLVREDATDNIILECALEGNADYIISGDRHLPRLKAFHGIPILTPRQFLEKMEQ